jgi:hypothetical protein
MPENDQRLNHGLIPNLIQQRREGLHRDEVIKHHVVGSFRDGGPVG